MTEIARACGVSQATVSLVLNNAPGMRISAATREAVLQKAHELGYKTAHRGPEKRPVIAMLINDVTCSPHVAGLIEGVTDAAEELGYILLVAPAIGDADVENRMIDYLNGLPVAGVIYTRLITQEVVVPTRVSNLPCVLLNCYVDRDSIPSVVAGDVAAGLTAGLALLDAGHRRVAFIGGEDTIEASRNRLKGYKRALAMRDVPYDPALVVKGGWTISGGFYALKRLRALSDPPTAVFCFCDRTAVGVYNAASEMGLQIGQDLSVIGFDNEAYTADMLPPLTTMELPHADMARHAVEQLVDIIQRPKSTLRHMRMKFDCPMIERGSIGPLVRDAALARTGPGHGAVSSS